MAKHIKTFDEWTDLFREWVAAVGVDAPEVTNFQFDALYGELSHDEIEFGDFAGRPRWKKVLDIPDQRIRDALMNLIVYQGDTEFASVEQQRHLFETAPTDYDRYALARVMREEMRHGWQMCHLLVEHFGYSGRVEAEKQLERRAWDNRRLLTSFNQAVENWLDFFTYTDFVDRDGKFQLTMLKHSSFAPLASSMIPMLKEESFHMGTGHNGIRRILKAARVPPRIIQKYLNRWISSAYDLFGVDGSSSAHWFYVWGLKGRYDEDTAGPVDKTRLNEYNRELYRQECQSLVDQFNKLISDPAQKLTVPDLKFNRKIGDYVGQFYDVEGQPVDPERYDDYLETVLPNSQDLDELGRIFSEGEWIEDRKLTGKEQ